jgi:four helix bundle protein
MKNNALLEKSFAFAIRSFNLSKFLREEKKEFIISRQIARSGMSIGANAEEANAAQSKKEFISKLQTSYKESKETMYWLRILEATQTLTESETKSIKSELEEISKILASIIISARKNPS